MSRVNQAGLQAAHAAMKGKPVMPTEAAMQTLNHGLEAYEAAKMEDDTVAAGFDHDNPRRPWVFLQWKGTNACFDFHCECGAHCHFDGYFAYAVKCPHCETVWEMPSQLYPRKADDRTYEHWRNNPQPLQPDEDF